MDNINQHPLEREREPSEETHTVKESVNDDSQSLGSPLSSVSEDSEGDGTTANQAEGKQSTGSADGEQAIAATSVLAAIQIESSPPTPNTPPTNGSGSGERAETNDGTQTVLEDNATEVVAFVEDTNESKTTPQVVGDNGGTPESQTNTISTSTERKDTRHATHVVNEIADSEQL
ncbi:hypothetical protein EIP86_001634 [Pleurotus ostreatoroseus]|nr:hypothetical protein EIP86_001634 [Pleurotus ostreatoroseus]